MTLTLNGQTRDFPDGSSLADVIAACGLPSHPLAIELDGQPVLPADHATAYPAEHSTLEIITLAAGG